jgi:chromosomal replication initiator protein
MNVDKVFVEASFDSWSALKAELERLYRGKVSYDFIESAEFCGVEDDVLVLRFPSEVSADYAAKNYGPIFKSLALRFFQGVQSIRFDFVESAPKTPEGIRKFVGGGQSVSPAVLPKSVAPSSPVVLDASLPIHSEYRFENFVEGPENHEAYFACRAVAEAPGRQQSNPLILCGGAGLGKSHLLGSIASFVAEHHTARKVVYRTADCLLREFRDGVRRKKHTIDAQKALRDSDVLLIDDVQFLVHKGTGWVQRELASLIQNQVSRGRQVVLVSDQPPVDIPLIAPNFSAVCQTGLMVDVRSPSTGLRRSLFEHLVRRRGAVLDDDVLNYLSRTAQGDVRSMIGLLTKIFYYCDLIRETPTVARIRQILGDLTPDTSEERAVNSLKRVDLDTITKLVSEDFSVSPEKLLSQSRLREAMLPRKVAMYLARSLTDMTFHSIGAYFQRDYGTVIWNVKALLRLMERNEDLALRVSALRQELSDGRERS